MKKERLRNVRSELEVSGMITQNVKYFMCVSCSVNVLLFATPWNVALQAPLSMGFSRQEYWNGLLGPPLGYHPDPGVKSGSLTSLGLAGRFFTTSAGWEAWQAP